MSIITNQDYLNALYGYKRIHCPKLTGLSKQQLGQLARRMGLDVIPTGSKIRPDGLGTGRHNYRQRGATTWRGTAQEREQLRNTAFDNYFRTRERGDIRAQDLDRRGRRDEELARVRADIEDRERQERERGMMGEEDIDAPAKPKPKKIKIKKKVKKSIYRTKLDNIDDEIKKKMKEIKNRQKNMTPAEKKQDDDQERIWAFEDKNRDKKGNFTRRYLNKINRNGGDALEDMMKEFKGLNLNLFSVAQKQRAIDSLIKEMGENFYVEIEKRMDLDFD